MTPQEIQERNKQIFKMLGYKTTWTDSYNWLMEVIEFIEKQKIKDNQYTYTSKYNVIIDSYGCTIRTSGYHQKKVIDITNSNKKEAVFIAVSDFAKIYNDEQRRRNIH